MPFDFDQAWSQSRESRLTILRLSYVLRTELVYTLTSTPYEGEGLWYNTHCGRAVSPRS